MFVSLSLPQESRAQSAVYKKFAQEIKQLSVQPVSATRNTKNALDSSSEYKVVIFWASWCPFCNQALKDLDTYIEKESISPDKLSILAISVDEEKKLAENYVKQKHSTHIDYVYTKATRDERNKLGVTTLPTIYILDKNGDIVSDYRGYGLETSTYLAKKLHWYLKNETSLD